MATAAAHHTYTALLSQNLTLLFLEYACFKHLRLPIHVILLFEMSRDGWFVTGPAGPVGPYNVEALIGKAH
jgi:hypothetical protein